MVKSLPRCRLLGSNPFHSLQGEAEVEDKVLRSDSGQNEGPAVQFANNPFIRDCVFQQHGAEPPSEMRTALTPVKAWKGKPASKSARLRKIDSHTLQFPCSKGTQ